MIAAIIGDIVGSIYEFNNIRTKDFPLFTARCTFTDDSVMSFAVASALLRSMDENRSFKEVLAQEMQSFGKQYSGRGYGGMFARWLQNPDPKPYGSYGNGSAMRVSPCGVIATSLEEALELARASAEVTHNHPEGVKGAQATAACIYMARKGFSKEEIRDYIEANFYPLDRTLDEIRPTYEFNETCQRTVPEAITAFLESCDFEDALRNAISLGGDSDTLAAIMAPIAWHYYATANGAPTDDMKAIADRARGYLPQELNKLLDRFNERCSNRAKDPAPTSLLL